MYFKCTCILYLEPFKFEKYFAFCILVSKTDVFCIENDFSMHFAHLRSHQCKNIAKHFRKSAYSYY